MNPVAIKKIREVQEQEGSEPCFRTKKIYCQWADTCCWAEICLSEFKPFCHRFNVVEK